MSSCRGSDQGIPIADDRHIGIRAPIQKGPDDVQPATPCCGQERSAVAEHYGIHIGSRAKEVVNLRDVALLGSFVESAVGRLNSLGCGEPANLPGQIALVALQHVSRIETGDTASGHKACDSADK